MSTGLRKPSRPPPPPPIDSQDRRSNNSNKKSDYIKISECYTGKPTSWPRSTIGFNARASTSFSSTLKPPSHHHHSAFAHQKSRSLTDRSSYLYLDLPSSSSNSTAERFIEYNTVDFRKTEALTKCKVERASGRA